jgi:hypothetical protein
MRLWKYVLSIPENCALRLAYRKTEAGRLWADENAVKCCRISRFAIRPSALRRELKVNRDGICLNWLAVHRRWLISPLKDRILCSFSKGGVLG